MSKSRDFLGPYRLARLIRQGTTSEVWEAIEENSQERFALKVLREHVKKDKTEIALLKHEYNIAKDLSSPRIIKVLDYREDGRPYLVMELFCELNMKQALRRGPESLAFMLDKIVEQSAEGLYYMHTKNWIHLDIKPDNFLVSREGVVKLIDFTISEKKKTGFSKLMHRPQNGPGDSQLHGSRTNQTEGLRRTHRHLFFRLRPLRIVYWQATVHRQQPERSAEQTPDCINPKSHRSQRQRKS